MLQTCNSGAQDADQGPLSDSLALVTGGKLVIAPAPDTPVLKGDKALYVKRAVQRTWSLIGKAGQQTR